MTDVTLIPSLVFWGLLTFSEFSFSRFQNFAASESTSASHSLPTSLHPQNQTPHTGPFWFLLWPNWGLREALENGLTECVGIEEKGRLVDDC